MSSVKDLFRRLLAVPLVLRIFIGLVIGAVLGIVAPRWTGIGILGTLFVGSLKAIAPVLVAVLVAASIAKANGGHGRRFRRVIGLYLVSTFCAAVVAALASRVFPVQLRLGEAATDTGSGPSGITEVFGALLDNLVANPVAALAGANYLGILFWAVLIGFGLRLAASEGTIRMVSDFAEVITRVVQWIIEFAPLGILGLVYSAVSQSGLEIFTVYGRLLALLVGCMAVNAFIFNPFISWLTTRRNPYPLLWACLKESGLNAMFTRSSAANIPVNLNLCRKLGLDEEFYSVSIPLGATINMSGAAVTITVMALAVAHTIGVEVGLLSSLVLGVVATLGACGTSGVAGGSILLIPMACAFLGIGNDVAMQAVAVGFIIGVVQDSVETALNSSADVFFTATACVKD